MFAGCALLVVFGGVVDLPAVVRDLSPFEHVSQVPAVAPTAAALLVPTVAAAALLAAGQVALRRWDVVS